jgi:hypothetical protein|tara:strand:- start:3022 stop:3903 length:882 start_codon:yes stop_codon:yes gene_type:complete
LSDLDAEPAPEDNTPEPSAEDDAAEALLEAELDDEAIDDDASDELEEAEVDGKRVRVSKGYRGHLLREDDYRRKTHTLGERERAATAKEADIQERAQIISQIQDEVTDARSLDKQIAAYKAVTPEQWRVLRDEDRDRYDDARADHSLLLDKRREAGEAINQRVNVIQQAEGQRRAQWASRQESEIKAAVADWGPTKEKEIKSHICEKFGFDANDVDLVKDAKLVKVMAHIHKQDMAIKRAKSRAAKVRGDNIEDIVPVRRVQGSGKPQNGPTARLLKNDPDAFDKAFLKSLRN